MMELIKNAYPGLKSIYETPHICGKCMEHIGVDWSFCPECGTPTGVTAEDMCVSTNTSLGRVINVAPHVPGDTVYNWRGQEWQVTSAELITTAVKPRPLGLGI